MNKVTRSLAYPLLGLGLLINVSVFAAPASKTPTQYAIHPHEDIRSTAENFLKSQLVIPKKGKITIKVGRLDSRLALRPCKKPLEGFLPHGGAAHKTSIVGIRCSAPAPWTLYVPVNVAIWEPVVVARRPIGRGVQLTEHDVTIALQRTNQLTKGYHIRESSVVGKIAKYYLRPGVAIAPHTLKHPILVRRGERVAIHAKLGRIHVRTFGKALKGGGLGDVILIRNPSSKRIVEARITGLGEAKVTI